ncbi:MAG: 16S rRNA (cytidine(1402)-2'-O)-methyltransferase [Bacilli bacterium]|nr:16S rRNA (cytidine(1402)-2'-O)-methyltransferase [Bacilli bacterium]
MSQKSYDGNASLYLIPTPIGNMDDITLRSIKTLEMVDFLLTEDTRITGVLLQHLNIKKRMYVNNDHNEEKNFNLVVNALSEGKNVGLVSDRGTPVISDPGYNIAKKVIEKGYNVVGLPGATALIPALITSGIEPLPFLFYGFLNSKDSKLRKELEEIKKYKHTIIFYEAPHRISKTLENMKNILGDRKISISREISKRYEEIYRGNITDVMLELQEPKGEFVIVIEGNKEEDVYDDLSIEKQVELYESDGMSKMEAIKKVAKLRKVPKSEIYNLIHGK